MTPGTKLVHREGQSFSYQGRDTDGWGVIHYLFDSNSRRQKVSEHELEHEYTVVEAVKQEGFDL